MVWPTLGSRTAKEQNRNLPTKSQHSDESTGQIADSEVISQATEVVPLAATATVPVVS